MIKNVVLTAIAILLCMPLHAQKLKKAFELLKQGEYDEAEILFNRASKQSVEPAATYFALGTIRLDRESGRYDTYKAFQQFKESQSRFQKTDQKSKDKIYINYGIKPKDADSMMRRAVEKEYGDICVNNHIDSIDRFCSRYAKVYKDLVARMIYHKDSLTFVNGCNDAHKYHDFVKLLSLKPESAFYPLLDSVYMAVTDEVYNAAFSSGNLYLMLHYLTLYQSCDPAFPENYQKSYWLYGHNLVTHKDSVLMQRIYTIENDTAFWNQPSEKVLSQYVNEFAPMEVAFYYLKLLVKPAIVAKDYQKAIDTYLKYRERFPQKHQLIDRTIGLLSEKNPPKFADFHAMPEAINSPIYLRSYSAVATPDMKTIYFCQDMGLGYIYAEDMYVSKCVDGKWQIAQAVEGYSNMDINEAPQGISPDETKLITFRHGYLYESELEDNGLWGHPFEIKSKAGKYKAINDGWWQADPFITADGQVMMFASMRPGNVGRSTYMPKNVEEGRANTWSNIDIYVSVKQPDGEWGAPINIGEAINTPFMERSPRLAPDLKTLYFTSNGHAGLGGMDLLMSRRLSDTSWTQWSEPINLGREINTAYDDWNFNIGFDGKTIFMSRRDKNADAIYQGIMPDGFRADATSVFSGKITGSDGKPLKADIVWEDVATGTHLGRLSSRPLTGEFSITLPLGRDYEYFVEHDGYVPKSGFIRTSDKETPAIVSDSIVIYSVAELKESGDAFRLDNIFFETAKADLKPESMGEIRHIALFLKDNPDLKIEISGHADRTGSDSFNLTLSQQRADAVKSELVKLGIPSFKIIAKGYGSTRQVSDNNDLNRRVEFRIVE